MDSRTSARTILDTWREQRADRLDPVRFHFIDAMQRRAADHDGEVRRILDGRLAELIDAYAADLDKAASSADHAESATPRSAPTTLGGLIEHIAGCAASRGDTDDAVARLPALPELDALGEFRKIWSKLRTESQLQQSLEQVPTNAGPLNSGALVHRAIALMRDLSPGYLEQFLSYVDALSWMEQMKHSGAFASADAPPAAGGRKRARDKRQPSANQADGRKRGTRASKSRTSSESMNS